MRRSFLLPVVAVASIVFGMFGPARSADLTPVEIHVITSLTGPAALVGKAQQTGLEVLEKTVNHAGGVHGRPVHFDFADDQSSPQVAVQLLNGFAAQKVAAVLGASLAATCRAMAAANTAGPVEYCISPGIEPAAGSYTFSAGPDFTSFVAASVRYLRGRGWHKIALLTTTDTTGQLGEKAVHDVLARPENSSMSEVVNEHFGVGDLQIAAQIAAIKASNADAVFLWVAGTPFYTAVRGLRDAGVDLPVLAGSANMIADQLTASPQVLPRQLFFQGLQYVSMSSTDAVAGRYIAALHAAGLVSDLQTGLAWDPAMMLIDALKAHGPGATADDIRTYISTLHGYRGIAGPYDFQQYPQRGLGVGAVVVMRWDTPNGRPLPVSGPGGVPTR